VSSNSLKQNVAAPLRPLAETAALFREECSALDHLVEELYRDIEQLRDEIVRKSDELEDGRRKLAQRGAQLAEQRKETAQLTHLLEQQEARLVEALGELKSLREHSQAEREEAKERQNSQFAFLEQKLRAVETERDQLRHEINILSAAGAGGTGESVGPLMNEFNDMRKQLADTQAQLSDTRTQLSAAIDRAAAAISQAPAPVLVTADGQPADEATRGKLATLEHERIELESELELVRTRATELQEVVNQQRRELVEQRADVTTELRLLRELLEQRQSAGSDEYEHEEEALVGATSRGESVGGAPDPVVSSVMAQFARLQKDVAQRRKKK
jgi:chromosome segregation ATPase